jgi:uncharacterized protein YdeI (YjbR/CyaY-like superfamily)
MTVTDPRVDAYIEKAEPFARPVLQHLRSLVHNACPEVKETIKWGFPHFEYKGLLCSMAAFKQHCAFGFWKAALMTDAEQFLNKLGNTGMGHFDRITSINDLPKDKTMMAYIREAVKLNEDGVQLKKNKAATKGPIEVPAEFSAALKQNKAAMDRFEKFSASAQREYIEWIAEAKTDATRNKRIETAVEWISEGKGRNWKYEKKITQ